jgi:hypothetical protein
MDAAEIKRMQRKDRRALVLRFLRRKGWLERPPHRPKQKPAQRIINRAVRAFSLLFDEKMKWGKMVAQIRAEFGEVDDRVLRRDLEDLLPEIAAARFDGSDIWPKEKTDKNP